MYKALSRRQSDGESVWDVVMSRSWPGRKSLNVLIHEAGPVPTGHSGTQGQQQSNRAWVFHLHSRCVPAQGLTVLNQYLLYIKIKSIM